MQHLELDPMSGFDIVGTTWWRRDGKDHFTVRDTMIVDNDLIVLTSDGRQLNYDTLNNYIQSNKPINVPKQQPKPKPVRQKSAAVEEMESPVEGSGDDYDQYLLPEDRDVLSRPLGSLKHDHPQVNYYADKTGRPADRPSPKVDNLEYAMVEKVLSKNFSTESQILELSIKLTPEIKTGVETLLDVLSVSRQSIREVTGEIIKQMINHKIESICQEVWDNMGILEQVSEEQCENPDSSVEPGEDKVGESAD